MVFSPFDWVEADASGVCEEPGCAEGEVVSPGFALGCALVSPLGWLVGWEAGFTVG